MPTDPVDDAAPPRVSVVTATMAAFDPVRRRTLFEVYEDLCAQKEQRFEWLVVCDGSEDALREPIAALNDPRVRLFGSPPSHLRYQLLGTHYGGYHQKAIGVRAARAGLLTQLDDDDRIYPDYLARLADTIEGEKLDFAICWIKTDIPGVPVLMPAPPFPVYTKNGFDVLCLMIRKPFLDALGGWPEHGGAIEPRGKLGDDETLLRIIVEKGRYRIIEEVLGHWRRLRS